MTVISEEEAKLYPDLYEFENNCIDFLSAMKRMREKDPNWRLWDTMKPAIKIEGFLKIALTEEIQAEQKRVSRRLGKTFKE